MNTRHIGFAVLAAGLVVGCGGGPTRSTCPQQQTLTYENFGRPFMQQYCVSCHNSTSAREGVKLDTLEGVRAHLEGIEMEAAAGPGGVNTSMPPNAPEPTEEERRQLGEWLACGAP